MYNQIQDILYTGRKIKKSLKGNEYKINEGKAIGIFKEKYIKIMLINNPKEAIKELDKLEKEIEKYTSRIRFTLFDMLLMLLIKLELTFRTIYLNLKGFILNILENYYFLELVI